MSTMQSRGTNPKGAANASENARNKPLGPSNKMTPPPAGSHKLTNIQRIPGGHLAGDQAAVLHHSLKKGKS
jgi:hypothetical protein